ncbi:MAG: hypothetical protein HUK20_09940 [Fibrobacter sp.]|nr:hypothetical protein [Fibrobacter sp.]
MGKIIIVAFLLLLYASCTVDNGYDPSPQYADRPVDYIVDATRSYNNYHTLRPQCNGSLEGKIFYVKSDSIAYACVKNEWVPMRQINPNHKELLAAEIYSDVGDDVLPSVTYKQSSITDLRDGKTYKTVIVGNYEWMAENLDYEADECTKMNSACADLFGERNCRLYKRCFHVGTYGSNLDTLCPQDFYMPDEVEWQELFDMLGGEGRAGRYLKAKQIWDNLDYRGTDLIGFRALPVGTNDGSNMGYKTEFCNSSYSYMDDITISIYSESNGVSFNKYASRSDYRSVRCVRGR